MNYEYPYSYSRDYRMYQLYLDRTNDGCDNIYYNSNTFICNTAIYVMGEQRLIGIHALPVQKLLERRW